jgi:hypothetical protein
MSSVRSPDGSAPRDHSRRGVVAASNPSSKHPTQKNQTPAAVSSSLDTIDVLTEQWSKWLHWAKLAERT